MTPFRLNFVKDGSWGESATPALLLHHSAKGVLGWRSQGNSWQSPGDFETCCWPTQEDTYSLVRVSRSFFFEKMKHARSFESCPWSRPSMLLGESSEQVAQWRRERKAGLLYRVTCGKSSSTRCVLRQRLGQGESFKEKDRGDQIRHWQEAARFTYCHST